MPGVKLIVFDTCRQITTGNENYDDAPFDQIERLLERQIEASMNAHLVITSAAGGVAFDGMFFAKTMEVLAKADAAMPVEQILQQASALTRDATSGRQSPRVFSALATKRVTGADILAETNRNDMQRGAQNTAMPQSSELDISSMATADPARVSRLLTSMGTATGCSRAIGAFAVYKEGERFATDLGILNQNGGLRDSFSILERRPIVEMCNSWAGAQEQISLKDGAFGSLRALLLSFEKSVVSTAVIADRMYLVGVTHPKSRFSYSQAREMRDELCRRLMNGDDQTFHSFDLEIARNVSYFGAEVAGSSVGDDADSGKFDVASFGLAPQQVLQSLLDEHQMIRNEIPVGGSLVIRSTARNRGVAAARLFKADDAALPGSIRLSTEYAALISARFLGALSTLSAGRAQFAQDSGTYEVAGLLRSFIVSFEHRVVSVYPFFITSGGNSDAYWLLSCYNQEHFDYLESRQNVRRMASVPTLTLGSP